MAPEVLADEIFSAMKQGKPQLIPGFNNRVFAFVGGLIPALTESMMKRIILDKLPEN
jgi:hypothetical protein